jgi:hypothetical protein
MNKTVRIEVWADANNLRAFPNVLKESVKTDNGFLMFKYGDAERNETVTVNLSNTFFYEMMDET